MIRVIVLGMTGDQIPLSLGESGSVTPYRNFVIYNLFRLVV